MYLNLKILGIFQDSYIESQPDFKHVFFAIAPRNENSIFSTGKFSITRFIRPLLANKKVQAGFVSKLSAIVFYRLER